MECFGHNEWALILGGSSGFGLASAKKLASMGMNLFIVHRDRKGAMTRINQEFAAIQSYGHNLHSFNINALEKEGRATVLSAIAHHLEGGKIKLLLHSIAFGNLKLIAPQQKSSHHALHKLATRLHVNEDKIQDEIDTLFQEGVHELLSLASQPLYNQQLFLNEEDMAQTIYNMGTNLLSWVQDLFQRQMFAEDARVLGLTSEGNEIAWRGYGAVSAAKAVLESISRTIACELGAYGIRSNILQPGITDTPALRLIPGNQQMKAKALLRNPLGRLTTPEDVADAVALMCMKESAWSLPRSTCTRMSAE